LIAQTKTISKLRAELGKCQSNLEAKQLEKDQIQSQIRICEAKSSEYERQALEAGFEIERQVEEAKETERQAAAQIVMLKSRLESEPREQLEEIKRLQNSIAEYRNTAAKLLSDLANAEKDRDYNGEAADKMRRQLLELTAELRKCTMQLTEYDRARGAKFLGQKESEGKGSTLMSAGAVAAMSRFSEEEKENAKIDADLKAELEEMKEILGTPLRKTPVRPGTPVRKTPVRKTPVRKATYGGAKMLGRGVSDALTQEELDLLDEEIVPIHKTAWYDKFGKETGIKMPRQDSPVIGTPRGRARLTPRGSPAYPATPKYESDTGSGSDEEDEEYIPRLLAHNVGRDSDSHGRGTPRRSIASSPIYSSPAGPVGPVGGKRGGSGGMMGTPVGRSGLPPRGSPPIRSPYRFSGESGGGAGGESWQPPRGSPVRGSPYQSERSTGRGDEDGKAPENIRRIIAETLGAEEKSGSPPRKAPPSPSRGGQRGSEDSLEERERKTELKIRFKGSVVDFLRDAKYYTEARNAILFQFTMAKETAKRQRKMFSDISSPKLLSDHDRVAEMWKYIFDNQYKIKMTDIEGFEREISQMDEMARKDNWKLMKQIVRNIENRRDTYFSSKAKMLEYYDKYLSEYKISPTQQGLPDPRKPVKSSKELIDMVLALDSYFDFGASEQLKIHFFN